MITINSSKYVLNGFHRNLVKCTKLGDTCSLYSEAFRVVDDETGSCFIVNGETREIKPVESTAKRLDNNQIYQIVTRIFANLVAEVNN